MSGLVHEHGHLEPHSLLSPEPMEAVDTIRIKSLRYFNDLEYLAQPIYEGSV